MILHSAGIRRAMARGTIVIEPFDERSLKNASYTFHLGTSVMEYSRDQIMDTEQSELMRTESSIPETGYLLQPGQFVVGVLLETVMLDQSVACLLSVRGSCAQVGLNALNSDLFVEPGWNGHLRVAITNANSVPVRLRSGMQIVKGIFFPVGGES
jgi:dCTP deaminase